MPELPPPLPPERRTLGQLVSESIRFYGQNFWHCLPLGLPFALADQLDVDRSWQEQPVVFWLLTPVFAGAYVFACELVLDVRPTRRAAVLAALIWLPFPALRAFVILPGLAWLAFIGLAVPASMVEGASFRASLVRGRRLGLGDYVHALGSLCALVVVVGVSSQVLSSLLSSQSDATLRTALFISDLTLSPLLFVGGALLYLDQSARLRSKEDAALHPPLDADPAGRPDAQLEP